MGKKKNALLKKTLKDECENGRKNQTHLMIRIIKKTKIPTRHYYSNSGDKNVSFDLKVDMFTAKNSAPPKNVEFC